MFDHLGFGVTDYAASKAFFLQALQPLGIGIVMEGELDMEVDGGKVVHLKAGDVVVQRGTNHAWVNNSGAPAKMA